MCNNRTEPRSQNMYFIYISTTHRNPALVVSPLYYFACYTRFKAYTYKHWTRIIIIIIIITLMDTNNLYYLLVLSVLQMKYRNLSEFAVLIDKPWNKWRRGMKS
jgi:hypothetical protein